MPKCTVCGKKETAMRCICSDCLDPKTNLGHALRQGMPGLVQMILDVTENGGFCRDWNECVKRLEAGEDITDEMCNKCITEWLLAPREATKP